LDDNLENFLMYGLIDPFSNIIGCREETFSATPKIKTHKYFG
jgi:hypothetical protein